MTTLEKLEKGILKLDEFDEQQKTFITALVKMSFIDGLQNKANLSDDIHNVSVCNGCVHEGTSKWLDPCHTCTDGDLKQNEH